MTDDSDAEFNRAYPASRYLHVSDIHGTLRTKIGKFILKEFPDRNGGSRERYEMYFLDADKPLVLNVTNARVLYHKMGPPSTWVGATVEIYKEMSFGHEGLRLRVIQPGVAPTPPPPAAASVAPSQTAMPTAPPAASLEDEIANTF